MKFFIILAFIIIKNFEAQSQNLYDNIYLNGFYPTNIYFSDTIKIKPLKNNFLNYPYGFIGATYSNICDSLTGKFLFCTNGGRIFTDSIDIMVNGDSMILSKAFELWQNSNFEQSTIINSKKWKTILCNYWLFYRFNGRFRIGRY